MLSFHSCAAQDLVGILCTRSLAAGACERWCLAMQSCETHETASLGSGLRRRLLIPRRSVGRCHGRKIYLPFHAIPLFLLFVNSMQTRHKARSKKRQQMLGYPEPQPSEKQHGEKNKLAPPKCLPKLGQNTSSVSMCESNLQLRAAFINL